MSEPRLDEATRHAIEDLIHHHAYLIDHGRAADLPELFTQDCRLAGIGEDKTGREAIRAWAVQRGAMRERRSRHVQTNIILTPLSERAVRGTVTVTVYRHDGPGPASPVPVLAGDYDDLYELENGTWRIAERRLTILFGQA